jgi:hypothetical protein
MARPKGKSSTSLLEQMLDEACWLLSHAQALEDYGRADEAAAEWARAASCEEQVACLLDADGQELEAAIHRVSAAWCCKKLGQPVRGATLLRRPLRPAARRLPRPGQRIAGALPGSVAEGVE